MGVNLNKDLSTKTTTMTQVGLIEDIIHHVTLTLTSNTKAMQRQTAFCILHRNPSQAPHQDQWNTRPGIGKLNFLVQNTQPDISFTIHQCA
jgi:hypothetical protein